MGERLDLCHENYGVGDTYPNAEYSPNCAHEVYQRLREQAGNDPVLQRRAIQRTAPALYFVCADRADGITSFPCTGSRHRFGVHTVCSCDCHRFESTCP
jgi:hypothetical protein